MIDRIGIGGAAPRQDERVSKRLRRFRASWRWVRDSYRLHLALGGSVTLVSRARSVVLAARHIRRRRTILFRPEMPDYRHVIYKICLVLGYRVTTEPEGDFDIAVRWHDTTFSLDDPLLPGLASPQRVLNRSCRDISKTRVSRIFGEVFGYDLTVAPRTHTGKAVRKSDLNARHDGKIIDCPCGEESGYVYQRLINNQGGDGLIQDIRVPVLGNRIPFVYLKYRPVGKRFSNANSRVDVASTADLLSRDETDRILRFCAKIGLDYGELDVLRDRDDGRLFIVDVNPTPWGPPNHISPTHAHTAVSTLARTFFEAFLS